METPESPPEDLPLDARPAAPRRRRAGGFSAESFLASTLLHLAVLFLVIVFAPNRPEQEHDAVMVDISKFVLPESAAPASTPSEVPKPASEPVAAGAPVEIPTEEEAAKAEEPAAAPAEPDPAETRAEPAPEPPAAEAAKAESTPPVPESSLPHGHGAYDPFEVYKAALAEQVTKVMTSVLNTSPILRVFRGRLVVHLYLDQGGRPVWFTDQAGLNIRGAAICLHHKGYQIEPVIPMNEATFRWHCEALDEEVVQAINKGAPYPAVPPGLEIPRELSYVFDLPEKAFHHPQLPQAPAAGAPAPAGKPPG